MQIIFEVYSIFIIISLSLVLQYLNLGLLFFPKEKESNFFPQNGKYISSFKLIFNSNNLNTILFWTVNAILSVSFIIIYHYVLTDNLKYLKCFLIISWGILLTFLITYKKNRFNFNVLNQVTFLIVILGVLYQISLVVNPNQDILKNIDVFFGSKNKFSKLFYGIYYFLTLNSIFSFVGGFIIRRMIQKGKDKKRSGFINYKGTEKVVLIFSLSISLIISLLFLNMDFKELSFITAIVIGGVALSLKDLISNFIAGLILLWDNSIKQDNVISLQNYLSHFTEEPYGWIDEINMRFTVIKDRNNINLIIPNSVLISKPIINWTQYDNSVRIRLDIDISYESDLEKAIKVIPEACREEDRVLKESKYKPKVNVMRFSDSAIGLQLRFYIKDPKNGIRNIKSKIFRNVIKILKQNNIEIPYPQRDIHLDIKNFEDRKKFKKEPLELNIKKS